MASMIVRTFDGDGNIVDEHSVEVPVEQANSDALDRHLHKCLDDLRAIANSRGKLTPDELSDAVRVCAGALISLTRHRLIAYDDTD